MSSSSIGIFPVCVLYSGSIVRITARMVGHSLGDESDQCTNFFSAIWWHSIFFQNVGRFLRVFGSFSLQEEGIVYVDLVGFSFLGWSGAA